MSQGAEIVIQADFSRFGSTYIHGKVPKRFSPHKDGQRKFEDWGEETVNEGVRLCKALLANGVDPAAVSIKVMNWVARERRLHACENGTPNPHLFGVQRDEPICGDLFYTPLLHPYADCGNDLVKAIKAQCPGLKPGRVITVGVQDQPYRSATSVEVISRADYQSRHPSPTLTELKEHVDGSIIDQIEREFEGVEFQSPDDRERRIVNRLMSDSSVIQSLPDSIYRRWGSAQRLKASTQKGGATPSEEVVVVTKGMGTGALLHHFVDYILPRDPDGKMSAPIIFHTDEVDISTFKKMLSDLFSKILDWDKSLPLDMLIEWVGLFRYIMGNSALFGRGSATIGELLQLISYRFHGIDCITQECDLWAIAALTHAAFLDEYKRRLKLNLIVPVTVSVRPKYTTPKDGVLCPEDLEDQFHKISLSIHPTLASISQAFADLTKTSLRTRVIIDRLPPPDPGALISNMMKLIPNLLDPSTKEDTYRTTAHGHEQTVRVKKLDATDPEYLSVAKYFTAAELQEGSIVTVKKEAAMGERSYILSESYVCVPKEESHLRNATGVIKYTDSREIQPIMNALEIHVQKALSWYPTTPIRDLTEEIATTVYFLAHLCPHADRSLFTSQCIEYALYRFNQMDCPTPHMARHALASPTTATFNPGYRSYCRGLHPPLIFKNV